MTEPLSSSKFDQLTPPAIAKLAQIYREELESALSRGLSPQEAGIIATESAANFLDNL